MQLCRGADRPGPELLEAIEEFCADRRPDDQLLIYLSCHGVLDDRGRLYYAASDTRRPRTAATAVAATWLNERLEDCRARSQIVILDCCHSGAFAAAAKGEAELALEQRFEPKGRGRVVLTASRGTEYSFEDGEPSGRGVQSVFTRAIVDGLRTGAADRDKDGLISVTDVYQYAYDTVRAAEPRQTPGLFLYGAEGDVLLAYSIRGAVIEPVPLPEDLRLTLQSPRRRVRESGVAELAELLDTAVPGLALSARQALQQISDEDLLVAAVARVALEASQGAAASEVGRELADRDQRERARQEALRAVKQPREQASQEATTNSGLAATVPTDIGAIPGDKSVQTGINMHGAQVVRGERTAQKITAMALFHSSRRARARCSCLSAFSGCASHSVPEKSIPANQRNSGVNSGSTWDCAAYCHHRPCLSRYSYEPLCSCSVAAMVRLLASYRNHRPVRVAPLDAILCISCHSGNHAKNSAADSHLLRNG